jgi:tetratricopeptide (TPR) repeat protein
MRQNYAFFIILLALMTYAQCQETAEDWLNKGSALGEQGKYDEAIKAYDEAIKAYDEAIRLDPKDAIAWKGKGGALLVQGKYDDAIKCYDEAIRLDPELVMARINKGIALGKQGKYDDAIKCYDEAIRLDPKHAATWSMKGYALFVQGKYDESIKFFEEAIRLDPKDATALDGKGSALLFQGKYDESIKVFEEALSLNPNDAIAWDLKRVALANLSKYDESIKAFAEAIRLRPAYDANKTDPTNITALLNDSADLYKRGMYDESLKRVDEAIALDPKNIWALFSKAIVLIDKREKVTKVFDEMVEYGFKDAYAWDSLAIYLAGDDIQYYEESIRCLDRAIAIYDESIRQNPKNATTWNNKGVALYHQASVDFTGYFGLTLYTDDASISKSSAHASYREDKWEKALECFDKATQLDPKCADAWYNSGMALYAVNDGHEKIEYYEETVKCFDQALALSDNGDGCLRLEDTRDAEFAMRNKLQELQMTSSDVDRVAAYA